MSENNKTLYLLAYTLGCLNSRTKVKKYKMGKLCDWCGKFNIFDNADICYICNTDMCNEIKKLEEDEKNEENGREEYVEFNTKNFLNNY